MNAEPFLFTENDEVPDMSPHSSLISFAHMRKNNFNNNADLYTSVLSLLPISLAYLPQGRKSLQNNTRLGLRMKNLAIVSSDLQALPKILKVEKEIVEKMRQRGPLQIWNILP